MCYLLILLELLWLFVLIVTGYTITRVLCNEGRRPRPFFSIGDMVFFWQLAHRQSTRFYLAVFWLCIVSIVMILLTAIVADMLYR